MWPFFLCVSAQALEPAPHAMNESGLRAISDSRYWKLLLHYRRGYLGHEASEADGAGFFFSPEGRTDPYAELLATIAAFKSSKKLQVQTHTEPAQCAFPERFRYLREEHAIDAKPEPCPDFLEWKARFRARSVSLVYAAPYLGSPASMFGHTFLRIDAAPERAAAKNPLLDRSISFEAFTGQDGGMGYVVKGLIGGYPGVFSLHPYYLKINAYNNIESRDLWEYEINLTPTQVDHLLNHAWEMGATYFNYYFFNRNCSYHLLSLLEVANPEWHLRENFSVMTIPADTIRALDKIPGAIRKRTFRPAILKILEVRLARMSLKEKDDFFRLKNNPASLVGLVGHETAATLDAVLDWQKYEALNHSKTVLDLSQQVDLKLLEARARASGESISEQQAIQTLQNKTAPPESGHLSSKLSLGGGVESGSGLMELSFRPALHDLMDADDGYLPHSRLSLGETVLQYRTHSPAALRLEKLTLAEVTNLSPWTALNHGLSWNVGGGFYHPEDLGCAACVAARVRAGAGVTLTPLPGAAIIYGLIHAQLEASGAFTPLTRFGPSAELGTSWDLSKRSKITVNYEYFKYFESSSMPRQNWCVTSAQANYAISKQWNLEFRGEVYSLVQEAHSRAIVSADWYF